jgi:hypothetical protein
LALGACPQTRWISNQATHVGEGVEVLVSDNIPVRTHHVGIDASSQFAERGVGVDSHHTIV